MLGLASTLIFAGSPVYDVVQFSYRLAMIPDNLQGRVNSSFRLIAWGSRPIGAAVCGFLLEWAGVAVTGLVFAASMLLLFLLAFTGDH